jgi:hypothetical protein
LIHEIPSVSIDLQLDHLISHEALRAQIQWAGHGLMDRAPTPLG